MFKRGLGMVFLSLVSLQSSILKQEIAKLDYQEILNKVIKHIEQSKVRAFSEVNKSLLLAYWNIGKELSQSATYGKSVVEQLSRDLRLEYPQVRGYSVTNLWNMKRFYETYQKLQPVVAESNGQKLQPVVGDLIFKISWTNHVLILDKTSSDEEKQFYLKACIKERWSKRELNRQLDSSLFERYMLVNKPEKVMALVPKHDSDDLVKHFKDDYVLEFLDLKKEYSEQELEKAILDNLRAFFLEFGKSFTFVAVDLKIGEFNATYVGQMQKYLAALDEKIRLPDENESIGLILCKSKNHEEVRFALAKTLSPVQVATYKTKLPDKELILKRLGSFKINEKKEI